MKIETDSPQSQSPGGAGTREKPSVAENAFLTLKLLAIAGLAFLLLLLLDAIRAR